MLIYKVFIYTLYIIYRLYYFAMFIEEITVSWKHTQSIKQLSLPARIKNNDCRMPTGKEIVSREVFTRCWGNESDMK